MTNQLASIAKLFPASVTTILLIDVSTYLLPVKLLRYGWTTVVVAILLVHLAAAVPGIFLLRWQKVSHATLLSIVAVIVASLLSFVIVPMVVDLLGWWSWDLSTYGILFISYVMIDRLLDRMNFRVRGDF